MSYFFEKGWIIGCVLWESNFGLRSAGFLAVVEELSIPVMPLCKKEDVHPGV